jgi:hypothetical protein
MIISTSVVLMIFIVMQHLDFERRRPSNEQCLNKMDK